MHRVCRTCRFTETQEPPFGRNCKNPESEWFDELVEVLDDCEFWQEETGENEDAG